MSSEWTDLSFSLQELDEEPANLNYDEIFQNKGNS